MTLTSRTLKHQKWVWPLASFTAFYALCFFPFAYFRHDDWLMLGNAVLRTPQNWLSLFSATWWSGGVEHVWFFRPLFKLAYFIGFTLFGFQYWLWLTASLGLLLASLVFAKKTIDFETKNPEVSLFFLWLFVGFVPWHFGSVIWAGEGWMNIPAVFLLTLSTYYLSQSCASKKMDRLAVGKSCFFFFLALGFKESSVFQIVFLFAFCLRREGKWMGFPHRLIPHIAITILYLIPRLFLIPLNHGYRPELSHALPSLLFFSGMIGLPTIALLVQFGLKWNRLFTFKSWASLFWWLFLLITIAPHIGHPFFSPGWLLYPGFFWAFALALSVDKFEAFRLQLKPWMLLIPLCILSLGMRLNQEKWWLWSSAGKEMFQIIQDAPTLGYENIRIRECSLKALNFNRIVGYPDGLSDLSEILHGTPIDIQTVHCTTIPSRHTNTLWLDWQFPLLEKSEYLN